MKKKTISRYLTYSKSAPYSFSSFAILMIWFVCYLFSKFHIFPDL
jgi:hypothetical protein